MLMTPEQSLDIPAFGWNPRPDQMPAWSYLERGGKRCDLVAHRRWGKDEICLQWGAVAAMTRIGSYWHMLPEAAQARKAIWDAVNPRTGRRRIDEAFPAEIRANTRESDMFIRFKNGSTWQVLGSDNYNSYVGSPPVGVTFSEWALANPAAWSYVRPILLENGGFALFIWTPRGRNHATRSFEAREQSDEWFTMRMPASVTGVFTAKQLENEKKEMILEAGSEQEGLAKYLQEYEVEFDAPVPGAYYGEAMDKLLKNGQIGDFPFDKTKKVITAWDLGIDDYTACWFIQRINQKRFHIVGYYETSDLGVEDIVKEAFAKKFAWNFERHYMPHDVKKREMGAGGRTIMASFRAEGLRNIAAGVPRDQTQRVQTVRSVLPYCYFDIEADGVEAGIDRLRNYKKRWNKSLGQYVGPLKDGNDHGADALGEFAMNVRGIRIPKKKSQRNPMDRYARHKHPEFELDWRTL